MAEETYRLFVGIDWALDAHQVCIIDRDRTVLSERSVKHEGPAIAAFVDALSNMAGGACAEVAVAIEVPRGAIVESMLERGFHVHAINPKQLDRFRDRHTVAGAKDDRRDALVLADSLRTDRHCFRYLRVDRAEVIELRELLRIDEDLAQDSNRLGNRIRDQIHRYYPQLLAIAPAADEAWVWELFELAPTPKKGARLKSARVAELLKKHRIRRITADEVVGALRVPAVHVAAGTADAAVLHVRLAIQRLRVVRSQQNTVESRLEELVSELAEGQGCEHRDVRVLLSIPGVGKKVVATVLAEASQALADRDYQALRALAGIAPVTQASGRRTKKRATVLMRQACNGRLRNAMYHWARVSAQRDEASNTKLFASVATATAVPCGACPIGSSGSRSACCGPSPSTTPPGAVAVQHEGARDQICCSHTSAVVGPVGVWATWPRRRTGMDHDQGHVVQAVVGAVGGPSTPGPRIAPRGRPQVHIGGTSIGRSRDHAGRITPCPNRV